MVEPRKATQDDLLTFHSPSYLQFLKKHADHGIDDLSSREAQQAEEYGLGRLYSSTNIRTEKALVGV